jgi:hypothetical protein
MKKLLYLLATLVSLCTPAFAATAGHVTVSGNNVEDSTGTLLASGTISFAPVNNSGAPISYRVDGNGQAISTPVTTLVTNGAFSIILADTSLTSPANVCYSVTIRSNSNGKQILGPGYSCVQPSASGPAVTSSNAWCTDQGVCSFDSYNPNLAALVTVQTGPTGPAPNILTGTATGLPNGQPPTVTVGGSNPNFTLNFGIPAGPSVPVGALMGAWVSTTTYATGSVVTFNGQTYISLTPNNTGNEPDTSPTLWGLLTSLSNLPAAFASQSESGPMPGTFSTVNSPSIISSSLPQLDIRSAGIVGDGLQITGCSITSGSTTLNCPAAAFSSTTDLGKGFAIGGAGASGGLLVSTITTVDSPTQVTLTLAASTSQTSTNVIYGTNNTNSWCTMVNCTSAAVPNNISTPNAGRILRAPRGNYLFFRSAISTGTPPTINTRNGDILQGDGGTNTEFTQIDNTNEPSAATADFLVLNSFNNAGVTTSDTGGLLVGVTGVMFQQPFNTSGGCVQTATSAGSGFVSGGLITGNWYVCTIGVKLSGNLIWLDHNTFDDGTSEAIVMSGSGKTSNNITHDVTISQNDFFLNHFAALDLSGGADIWIVNNWFADDFNAGAIVDTTASNFRYHFRNNDFNASTGSFSATQVHLEVVGTCTDCDAIGNTFEFGRTNDIILNNSGIINWTSQGNKFFDSSQSASGTTSEFGAEEVGAAGPGLVIEDETFNAVGQYGILSNSGGRFLRNQCYSPFSVNSPIGAGADNFNDGCIHFLASASGVIELRQNSTTSTTDPIVSLNGTTAATVISSENTSGFAVCAVCLASNQAAGSWVTSWNENSIDSGSTGQSIWGSFFNSTTGNMSIGGNMTVAGHINQTATNDFAGTCTMNNSTSCTVTLNKPYSAGAICVSNAQNTSVVGGASSCGLTSSNIITITATNANSLPWGAVIIGNPN